MLYGNYKPVLWKSDPLRFSGLPPQIGKNGWWRCCHCAYCLFTNKMSVRLCPWSVCHPYFLLLFAHDVNQKSMCHKSCQISVGNFNFYIKNPQKPTWKWKLLVSKFCSSCRQMNKVYKKYNFCILSLNMTGATIFLLFPTENLKFPWQWWLHIHWAALAVNRLRTLPFTRPLLFLYASM